MVEAARTPVSNVRICVVPDPLAAAVAHLLLALRTTIRDRGTVRLAVAGGSVLPVLEAAHRQAPEVWPALCLTWADERAVVQTDAASNCGAARRAGVLSAPAPRVVLPLLLDYEVRQPASSLQRVQAVLSDDFEGALDVTLLGLGEDGHIASLFPGHTWGAEHATVMQVTDAPKPPAARITLTRALLQTARTHIVFAVGVAKRDAIARVLAGDPDLPLSGMQHVHLYTDQPIRSR